MVSETVVDIDVSRSSIRGRFCPRTRQIFACRTPSLTQQDRAAECDINRIVARHAETGLWGESLATPTRQPMYGDFTADVDLYTAQKLLCTAKESFASLPSDVRKEFGNDALVMLKWLENPANYERGVELGLLEKRSEQGPLDVTVPTDTLTGSVPKEKEVVK